MADISTNQLAVQDAFDIVCTNHEHPVEKLTAFAKDKDFVLQKNQMINEWKVGADNLNAETRTYRYWESNFYICNKDDQALTLQIEEYGDQSEIGKPSAENLSYSVSMYDYKNQKFFQAHSGSDQNDEEYTVADFDPNYSRLKEVKKLYGFNITLPQLV